MNEKCLTPREIAKDIRWEMAVYSGSSSSSAAVFSQFHIVLHKSIYYARFQCCDSHFGGVPCLVTKSGTFASSLC